MRNTTHYTNEQIEEARQTLTRAAMLHVAGLFGPELTGVEVNDHDCIVYLNEQALGIELNIAKYLGMN